jgi:uncharacterized protein (DUF885 family)
MLVKSKPFVSATLFFLFITTLPNTNFFAQTLTENNALRKLFDNYYDERLKLFPLDATRIGDNRYNDLLPNDGSAQYREQVHKFYLKYKNQLAGYKRGSLNETDKISYDILTDILNKSLEAEKLHPEYIPFAQFFSLPLTMGQLGSGKGNQPFTTVQDYENWVKRMTAFSTWTDTAIANFRRGIKAGVVLPKALVVRMIPQMESLSESDTSKSVFYGPVRNFPAGFTDAEKSRLTKVYNEAISAQLLPSYKKFAQFFKTEYLPQARMTSGLSALPNGKAIYDYDVYNFTTLRKNPEEFYQTGLKEVDRITNEMEKLKSTMGFTGSLKDLFTVMRNDKQFMPFTSDSEVIAANWAVLKKIEPKLKELFSVTPATPFEIRPVEKFRAAAAAPQYDRSSADGKRPGIYYIPILDPTKINVTNWALEGTFLHEAIPGHHYQVSLQQEDSSKPKFRRFAFFPAFSEGWALYTESLGEQLGCYTDPYQKMGAYGNEIHRAIRLVVDVALHTGKMTREEGIAYMMAHEALNEQAVTAEIERYMAMPGQALSYKTGELKIKELRDKYKQQLGPRFNLTAFHDAILKGGAMPLSVFESYMDQWAFAQQ